MKKYTLKDFAEYYYQNSYYLYLAELESTIDNKKDIIIAIINTISILWIYSELWWLKESAVIISSISMLLLLLNTIICFNATEKNVTLWYNEQQTNPPKIIIPIIDKIIWFTAVVGFLLHILSFILW